jgi:hypothetical protein
MGHVGAKSFMKVCFGSCKSSSSPFKADSFVSLNTLLATEGSLLRQRKFPLITVGLLRRERGIFSKEVPGTGDGLFQA